MIQNDIVPVLPFDWSLPGEVASYRLAQGRLIDQKRETRLELATACFMSIMAHTGAFTPFVSHVHETGLNQFHYVGHGWGHCTGGCNGDTSGLHNGSNSWGNVLNDTVMMTFTGTQIVFDGVKGPRHGIGSVSIDGGTEALIDFYSPTHAGNQLLWTSPLLRAGTHTFKLRVTHTKNPRSSDFFVAVDRVTIRR